MGTTTREKKRIGKSHERMVVDDSQVSSYPQMIQGCDLSTQNMLLIRKIVRFIFASAFERTTTGQNFGSYRSEISFLLFFFRPARAWMTRGSTRSIKINRRRLIVVRMPGRITSGPLPYPRGQCALHMRETSHLHIQWLLVAGDFAINQILFQNLRSCSNTR